MSIEAPASSRGPILTLTLPTSELPVDLLVRNKTTEKSLALKLTDDWDGDDLTLDWYRRTIKDQEGADRSALLDPDDNELWLAGSPLAAGANSIEVEVSSAVTLEFVDVSGAVGRIAVDSTHIYWSGGSGFIARAKLDGSEPDEEWIEVAASGIAVDSTYVYWTDQTGSGFIGRAKLDGSEPDEEWIEVAKRPEGIAVDASHIYWIERVSHFIGRANLDGSEAHAEWLGLELDTHDNFGGVGVDSTYLYWTGASDPRFIARAKLDGSEPDEEWIEVGTLNEIRDLAVDDTHIYWADNHGSGFIGRAKIDGSEVDEEWVPLERRGRGVAVGGAYLYWTATGDDATGEISRASLPSAYSAKAVLSWERGYY